MNLRYALRMLGNNPGFSIVAVLALGLGIGADTAIFSVVDAVVLRPLPYHHPDELVVLRERTPDWPTGMSVAYLNFVDWRKDQQVFTHIAARQGNSFNLTDMGEPERIAAANVSAATFPMLGVTPILGRAFTEQEDVAGGPKVVLLQYRLWERRFAKDPKVIGRAINLDGVPTTVIGVMPAGFRFPPTDTLGEMFVPIGSRGSGLTNRGSHPGIQVYARLKPGVSMESANANLNTIAVRLQKAYIDSNRDHTVYMDSVHHNIVRDVRPILMVILGAVGFVLLIACTNVANLLLARAAKRAHEISIRTALGASRGQIVKQMLTESLLLGFMGGAVGILLAWGGVRGLIHFIPPELPRIGAIAVDARVLIFSVLLSVITGLAFGILPAVQISRSDPQDALREGGRRTTGDRKKQRTRGYLVIAEVALSLVLLIGAGLTIKSFYKLSTSSPGLDPHNTLALYISLPNSHYPNAEKRLAFSNRLLEVVRAMPGVQHAGFITPLPLGGSDWETGVTYEGRQMRFKNDFLVSDIARVSPDYFATMGIAVKKGRAFTDFDNATAPPVAIIDERFVQQNFPKVNPIGRKIKTSESDNWLTVVGVVAHVKNYGIDADSRMETYRPLQQFPIGFLSLVVRTEGDPAGYSSAIRRAVQTIDPNQPIYNITTMQKLLDDSMATKRVSMLLFSVFAAAALLLSALGLYGVISYQVTQRTHEIGVRMALGAASQDVLSMVVGQGALLVAIGTVIGLGTALALGRFMQRLLFGVAATDLATFVVVAAVLVAVALLATYLPARRAARVDPMVALRYE